MVYFPAIPSSSSSSSSSSSYSSRRILEIKVISGEDLRINQRRQSVKNSFVLIKTDSEYPGEIRTTKLNTDGGSNPEWDEKLVMDMSMHARFVTVEVQCKKNGINIISNSNNNNRMIGTARIPVSDFMGGLVPENYLHFLSYRLRDTQGERNGIINLSVRIKNPAPNNFGSLPPPLTPLVFAQQQQQKPPAADSTFYYNKDQQGPVVTGIPVRLPNFNF